MSELPVTEPYAEVWTGEQLLGAFRAGAHWLDQHAEMINALNVFPVPDGDTGTNMSLTMNGAVQDIDANQPVSAVADRVRYWATMRGRGNSGIILSQVLRGMALGLANHETMDGKALAEALIQASATAYKAVMKPIEGTMLTVIREASEAAQAAASSGATVAEVLAATVRGADASVERTPTLLKTLRDAGVVDSGGKGLAVLFEGMRRYAYGEAVEAEHAAVAAHTAMSFDDIHGPDDFGYCTNFIVRGKDMAFSDFRSTLAEMGESAVIVGDDELIKVHIHMLRPGDALNYAAGFGALTGIEITNMDMQREQLHAAAGHPTQVAATPPASASEPILGEVGVVAVVLGDGFANIFRSLNVGQVIAGQQLMNPSAEELLSAITQLPQQQVIVLPNNSNVIMTAKQAAELSNKQVAVVPTRTIPQGIAAMFGYNFQADVTENSEAMTEASTQVTTAEITTAVRDATVDGVVVHSGQMIGLVDGDLVVASNTPDEVFDRIGAAMDLANRELVTIYAGKATPLEQAEMLAAFLHQHHPNLASVEVQEGGQTLYEYIIAAE